MEDLATEAWKTYKKAVGGLDHRNDPLPEWDKLEERQQIGWAMAASRVADIVIEDIQRKNS